ncbi:ras and Rab interactor 3-like [Rhinophrynus dorsalis]
MKLDVSASNKQGQNFCSIQVTSENGALCIINPLFIHEHGDKWLTHSSKSKAEERRKSVSWCYRHSMKSKSIEGKSVSMYEPTFPNRSYGTEGLETTDQNETKLIGNWERLNIDVDHEGQKEMITTVLCEALEETETKEENRNIFRKSDVKIDTGVGLQGSENVNNRLQESIQNEKETLEYKIHEKRNSFSPCRVSWIEVEQSSECTLNKSSSETSLNSSDSFLLPPLPELDSVSISSFEEDGDCHSLPSRRKHSPGLGDMVRHSLLAVSTVLTSLVSPEKHLGNRIQQLAEDPTSYLGGMIQTFICNMFKGSVQHQSSTEMLQGIRQLLTNLKTYLLESNEIWDILEHQDIDDYKIAFLIETSLHKCVLKPVQDVIYSYLLDLHRKDGSLSKLLENQQKMKAWGESNPKLGMPGPGTMEKIQNKLSQMHVTYSPEKMIRLLLKVCKLIYESMEASSGKKEAFGADDFLPVLINVLLGCDLTSLQLDVEYMMELVDPSQLQGEGGYYLTTLFGALYHISTFNTVSRQLSMEAQNSIRQWQRRRTIHYKHSFQKHNKTVKKEDCDPKYEFL